MWGLCVFKSNKTDDKTNSNKSISFLHDLCECSPSYAGLHVHLAGKRVENGTQLQILLAIDVKQCVDAERFEDWIYMLTCKQKRAFEGYEVKWTEEIKRFERKTETGSSTVTWHQCRTRSRVVLLIRNYTSDNYRAVTARRFMTHPRMSTHSLMLQKKQTK